MGVEKKKTVLRAGPAGIRLRKERVEERERGRDGNGRMDIFPIRTENKKERSFADKESE